MGGARPAKTGVSGCGEPVAGHVTVLGADEFIEP